jgi:sodium-dependent dicarboxylate transporter 2/3/5
MSTSFYKTLQLFLIFTHGFLISRLFIKHKIAEKLVIFIVKKAKSKFYLICAYILLTAAVLSMFIPNVITVLSILPVINILKKESQGFEDKKGSLTTSLALSNMYGANIGGTGSLSGSLSNAVLLGFLILNAPESAKKVDFLNWLGWGLPFAIIMSLSAIVMLLIFLPKSKRHLKIYLSENVSSFAGFKKADAISLVTLVFWIGVSLVNNIFPLKSYSYTTLLCLIFSIALMFMIFIQKGKKIKKALLSFKDIFINLPWKGFAIAFITVILSGLLLYFKADRYLSGTLKSLINFKPKPLLLMFIFSLMAIYISEFISNTATAVTLFVFAFSLCRVFNYPPLPFLICISVSSTLVFASPLASPVNALSYGGVKGINLKKMIITGLFIDLGAAVVISFYSTYFISRYYKLFF